MIDKVYIASPFFNKSQLEFVMKIESELDKLGISYFSPHLHGIIKNMSLEEKAASIKKIYDKNIINLVNCDFMIAVIDDFDVGTMFEIGYFTSQKDSSTFTENKIITITEKDYGLNVMLSESVDCHIKSMEALEGLLYSLVVSDCSNEILNEYDSNREVTT